MSVLRMSRRMVKLSALPAARLLWFLPPACGFRQTLHMASTAVQRAGEHQNSVHNIGAGPGAQEMDLAAWSRLKNSEVGRGHLTTTHEDRGLEAGSTTQISGERSVGINTWSSSSSCTGCTVWTGMQGADCWFSFRWSGLYARATRSRTLQRSKSEIAKSREWRVAC